MRWHMGRTHTYWCTHTRTGVRWVTAHSTHTHAHKYIKHASCSSLRMQTALARRTQSIKNTTTEYRMNQRHHGEHAMAVWRTKNQRKEKKKKKKKGEAGPLFPFYGPIREGKGFWVTPCRKGGRGGGGLAICVQVRDEPIRTRLHVSHRVMGWKKKVREKGI